MSIEHELKDLDEGRVYRWEIEPHPDTSDCDVLVTDSDEEALAAIERAGEMIWNEIENGETRSIVVKCNADPTEGSPT